MIQENIGFQIAYFLSKQKWNYNGRALALYLSSEFLMILARMENENIRMNLSTESFVIKDVDRIFQILTAKHEKAKRIKVNNPFDSERSIDWFGNTGKIQL